MNGAMIKALALDAYYQVVDNKVFRILLILVLLPILVTFVVGFREDEISLLFGFKSWSYTAIGEGLSMGSPKGADVDYQGLVVSKLVSLFVDTLGGTFGVMLAIAATSFFVPRMIEKGAADVLFHKPIPRGLLLLSRYFAGLLFIALVSAFAVVGIYLGLLLVSGYNDPGILWGALTLTYLFGLVHCVSMLVGVVTRSTVAAILVTLIFFFCNGCVHKAWIFKEQIMHQVDIAREEVARAEAKEEASEDGEEEDAATEPEEEEEEERSLMVKLALGLFDAVHFVLPKTTDAAFITAKLRDSFDRGWVYEDKPSRFGVLRLEGELAPLDASSAPPPPAPLADLLGEPVLAAATAGGERTLVVRARDLRQYEEEFAGRMRTRTETARRVANEAADQLSAEGGLAPEAIAVEDQPLGLSSPMNEMGPLLRPTAATVVRFEREGRAHAITMLSAAGKLFTIELAAPAEVDADEREAWERSVLAVAGVRNEASEEDWYKDQLSLRARPRYNVLVSIGSSLAFAAGVLLLAWWRLSRVDF